MRLRDVNEVLQEMVESGMRGLGTLRPRDMIGDPDRLTRAYGKGMRPSTARTKKFRAMVSKLTGKKDFSFDEAYAALVKYGLDKKAAHQYAMFATDRFGDA